VDNQENVCHSALQIISEYKHDNETIQAHCDYKNLGPWYDWVMFKWENLPMVTHKPECCVEYLDNPLVTQTHDYAPGQIIALVVCTQDNESDLLPHVLAVVKT
jgi:hypothetical protein